MKNLEYYEKLKNVPESALKAITGGRLKGKSSINPMWRIEKMTEIFGPVGIGWKTEIINKEISEGADGEKMATVDINLYVKVDDKWSEAIPGTGGSMFVEMEKAGPHTSDECYKMAYTDAMSVAMKALGLAADIYWGDDTSDKYSNKKLGLSEHDIFAIQKRLQEKVTSAIHKVGGTAELANKLGISEKMTAKILTDYIDVIAKLEKRIDAI